VATVEEGIEILTGMPAGTLQEDGTFPEGTVFGRVAARLGEIRAALKKEKDEGEEKDEDRKGD